MPVVTRSKSKNPTVLPSARKIGKPRPPNKLSQSRNSSSNGHPVQHGLAALKRQKPGEPPRKHQSSETRVEVQPSAEAFSPDLFDDTIIHWPCRICTCPQGTFRPFTDACVRCGHDMDGHEHQHTLWIPKCEFVCERQDLVNSILRLVRQHRVVVIRATNQVGKTTLLKLLGRHVLYQQWDLEPVYINWWEDCQNKERSYDKIMQEKVSAFREENNEHRPRNVNARTLYLIDEAQSSYQNSEFWKHDLAEHNTRSKPLFILVCLYGASGLSHEHEANVESQALFIDVLQRVELRPLLPGHPYLLFTLPELIITVQKWATQLEFMLEDGVYEYLHSATGGHPGAVGLVLDHLERYFLQLDKAIQQTRTWTPNRCHIALISQDGILDRISFRGRGYWSPRSIKEVKISLQHPYWRHIRYSEVTNALREVVIRPHGYIHPQNNPALTFCHKMGYLYTEESSHRNGEITYTFPSPIHRRIAFRRLCPGPESNTGFESRTLQQVCLKAIERFSPSVFSNRLSQSHGRWGIPEAAFQDEMYCCLNFELNNLPILSEYSHDAKGRIDFYIFDRKWGIEILQCGTKEEIKKHAARFRPGGQYHTWNIFQDYIILNFCSRSTLRKIEIEDLEVSSRIFQILIEPDEYIAKVFTIDMQLQATLDLGEGRERHYVEEYEAPKLLNAREISQRQIKQKEQEMEQKDQEMKEMKQKMEKMAKEVKLEIDQLRDQLK